MSIKKEGVLAQVAATLAPIIFQAISDKMKAGENIDPNAVIDEVSASQGVTLDDASKQEILRQYEEQQAQATQQMEQNVAQMGTASASSRELMNKLNHIYTKENLDFLQAMKIWKFSKLTPDRIRHQIANDVGSKVSLAEAKLLYRIGSDLVRTGDEINCEDQLNSDVFEKLQTRRSIKLTPTIREAVERVGKNLYRTKKANIMWKIDMKHTDDGQQIPYLLRIESAEDEEQKNRNGK